MNKETKEVAPPKYLYHATSQKNIDSIIKNGINKMDKPYVKLSDSFDSAREVGEKYEIYNVLIINSEKMYEDGYEFYQCDNKVWLSEYIPFRYISL